MWTKTSSRMEDVIVKYETKKDAYIFGINSNS